MKYTLQQRQFFNSTSEATARRIWKSHTGNTFRTTLGSAVTWCMYMNYLTMPNK